MTKLLALCLLCACSVKHVQHSPPNPSEQRADILAREIAWIGDNIPVIRFNPPYIYGAWRLEVEACSGKQRAGWPKFYVAPVAPLAPDGRVGFYAHDSNVIVFALGHEAVPWIYRHEILHFLLNGEFSPRNPHPDEYFGPASPCGPLVRPA